MQAGTYISAAGALAAEARLDVASHNLANIDTPGFRRGLAIIQSRAPEALEAPRHEPAARAMLDGLGGGLLVHEVTFDAAQGAHEATEDPFHLALDGDGWFVVERDGERLYTRAGNFLRDPDGVLTTADGSASVLDVRGRPVLIPDGHTTVTESGDVLVDDRPVARLLIAGEVDSRVYEPVGDTFHRFLGEGRPEATDSRVRQGFVERSGVSPIQEMVRMIRTFRAYEANMNMIRRQDEALGRAVNDVGRVG